ncbi:MAG: hypothetical protein ABIP89_20025 [Polyangiaceae bacterium]
MINQGDENDPKDEAEGAAADDDPDGVGLTIPVPSMVKPWTPPAPKAPPKKSEGPSPDDAEEKAP